MAQITGLGGAFVRVENPEALYTWYERHLGLTREHGSFTFSAASQRASLAVSFFPKASKYFPPEQPAMLNFQVDDSDAVLDKLSAAGVMVDPKRETYEYGRFG